MPRTEKQNQAIRDKRKAKITQEGIKLISMHGLNEVVIDDIAKEVGCSHGLFYHYYKKTEDLYAEIPTFMMESKKIRPYVDKYLVMGEMKPDEAIKHLAKELENLPSYPKLVLYTADVVFTSICSLKDFGFYDFFINLFEKGQKEGTIKEANPEALLLILLDVIDGYITRCIKMGPDTRKIPSDIFAGIFLK